VERRGDAAIVHITGEVDLTNAAELRQVLVTICSETPSVHLIIDLSDVAFIDSTGIGVIVGAHRRVTAKGGRFTAIITTPMVHKVLQTTGLLSVWRVTASIADALADD
jgi:anti-sigma B factor antagonist